MSAPGNVALALTLLLGTMHSVLAASTHHRKSVRQEHAQKLQQHAPSAAFQNGKPGCVSDEGGGRIRPCGGEGSGSAGGGGGM
jgi:hypothetical protein